MNTFLNKYIINDSDNWLIDDITLNILEDEINRWKAENPNKEPDNDNNLKGRLGEIYVAECLKRQLYGYGFKYSYKSEPMSFRLRYQYPQDKGIDIYLRIIDDNCKVYRIFIEVCNWGKYHSINWYVFLTRIQFKFFKWDWKERYYHIIAINHRNVSLIEDKVAQLGTYIIPLREHITPDFIQRIRENKMYCKEWINGYKTGRVVERING